MKWTLLNLLALSILGVTCIIFLIRLRRLKRNHQALRLFSRRLLGAQENGVAADQFGFAVAVNGDTVAVGAPFRNDRGTSSGTVYIFDRNQGGTNQWGLTKQVLASDGANGDELGYSVALSGDIMSAGVPFDDDKASNSGTVYTFERNQGGTNNWGLVKKVYPADPHGGDQFGFKVPLSGTVMAVGSPLNVVLAVA